MPLLSIPAEGALQKSTLRDANDRLVLDLIRRSPWLSRSDLVRLTGLAPSSVTFIVNRLMRQGLLLEEPRAGPVRVGRRPVGLRLRPNAMLSVGVDVSAPAARLVLAGVDGNVRRRAEVPWLSSHEVFLGRINQAILEITQGVRKRLLGVGVGLPGTIDRASGRVVAAENLGWFDVEAGGLLRRGMKADFWFDNDARLSALAERWFGEPGARPLENFVFVTARAGLGAGIVVEGRLLRGAFDAASEFGHTVIHPEGRPCVCGNRGCWEEYASGRALSRIYVERAGTPSVEAAQPVDIVGLARAGHPPARGALEAVVPEIALGFANLVMAFNPEAIVVGDYFASGWDLLGDAVWSILRERVPDYHLSGLSIRPTRHGAESHLVGGVALVLANFFALPVPGAGVARASAL